MLALWLLASLAQAQAPTSLAWARAPGAESCIVEADLRDAVEARLSRSVFVDEAPLRIEGEIAPSSPGFRAHIVLSLHGEVVGERTLDSRRRVCGALDDSLVLMVALLVEVGEQAIEVTLPEPEPVAPPAPAVPEGALERVPQPVPPEPSGEALRWSMTLGARGAIDVLPGPALGIRGSVELGWPFSVRLAGAYFPDVGVTSTPERAARLGAGWGQLGACGMGAPIPWLELGGCASLSGGALLGTGIGFDVTRSGVLPWIAIDLEGRVRALIASPVALELAVGLEVPLAQGRFVAGQGDTVRTLYALPWVAPHLDLSLVLWAR